MTVNFGFAIQSLSDMKFPSFVEKYMQADSAKKELSLQMPNYGNPEKSFSSWLGPSRYESNVPAGLLDVDVSIVLSKTCLESYPAFLFSIDDVHTLFCFVSPLRGIHRLQIHRCECRYGTNFI